MRRLLSAAALLLAAVAAMAADRPGWLGLSFSLHRGGSDAAFLQLCAVAPNGPAARAGLRARDLITHIDGKRVAFANDAAALHHFARLEPHQRIRLRVARGTRSFDVTVVARPMTDDQYGLWLLQRGGR